MLSGCAHIEERAILDKTVLQPILSDLVSGNVTELRIIDRRYTTTPWPASERDIESYPDAKDISLPLDESTRMELVDALRRTQLESLPGASNLGCGVVFYGNGKRRLFAFWMERTYLFQRNRTGTIDGYRVKIVGPLPKWVEKQCSKRTNY